MKTAQWIKDYSGNKFYPYTHTDAVLVGNEEESKRNLTDELNQINNRLNNANADLLDGKHAADFASSNAFEDHLTSIDAHQELFNAKLDMESASNLIKDIASNPDAGIITATRMDDTTFTIHIPKTLVFQSAVFDGATDEIVITWSDSSQSRIPVDGLIDVYTGSISETIQISISEENTISAIIKEGSINRNLLSPDLQGDIQSAIDHLSHTQSHITDGGDVGQIVGMTDGGIGWVMPQLSDNTPTKMSQLENDCNYISESVLANALAEKIDKIEGMGLSSNDYSSDQKEKLLHIEDGANKYVHPETHPASMITEDETHQFVTSEEKALIGKNISSNGSTDIKYLYIPINRCVNASDGQITSGSSYTLAKDTGIYIGITISKEHYEILKDYIVIDISMHSFPGVAGTAHPYNNYGYVYKIGNYQNVNIGSLERHYLRQVHVYNPSPSYACNIHGFYCSFIKADFEELKE